MGAAFYIAVEDDLSDAVVRRLLSHARRGFQVCGRYPLSPLTYLKPELTGHGYLKANVRDRWDVDAAAGKADSLDRALRALRSFKPT